MTWPSLKGTYARLHLHRGLDVTRREDPGTCEEDPEEQSAQPGRQDVATGPDPYALLTVVALMGAEMSTSSARISIRHLAYSLTVRWTWSANRRAAFSIVLVGNQIEWYTGDHLRISLWKSERWSPVYLALYGRRVVIWSSITRIAPIIRSCVRLFLAAWLSTYQGVLSDDLIMLPLAISH